MVSDSNDIWNDRDYHSSNNTDYLPGNYTKYYV